MQPTQFNTSPPLIPAEGYIRLKQVIAIFPVSRSTFLAGVKSGRYPSPVKISPRTNAWRVEDIRALIESVQRAASHQKA